MAQKDILPFLSFCTIRPGGERYPLFLEFEIIKRRERPLAKILNCKNKKRLFRKQIQKIYIYSKILSEYKKEKIHKICKSSYFIKLINSNQAASFFFKIMQYVSIVK